MIAILILLLVVATSVLIVHIGTVALTMTGISRQVASFQALSAFTGAGFTTGESDEVINTAARRRIISLLIRIGSVGLATFIGTLALSFLGTETTEPNWLRRTLLLLIGVSLLYLVARSQRLDDWITPLIKRQLAKQRDLALYDYDSLLHLRGGEYKVIEIQCPSGTWLVSRPLGELRVLDEGIVVLGVQRSGGDYVGNPPPSVQIRAGDRVVLYGLRNRVDEIVQRQASDHDAHREGLAEHAQRDARAQETL